MKSTAQKAWLITGASSGLVFESFLAALRAGDRVIGTSRDVKKTAASKPEFVELGGSVIEAAILAEEERQGHGSLHWIIVNNAGNVLIGSAEDVSEKQLSQYLQANISGAIRLCKLALPILRRYREGTLITTSSIWGFYPKPEHMLYSAVKAAMESDLR